MCIHPRWIWRNCPGPYLNADVELWGPILCWFWVCLRSNGLFDLCLRRWCTYICKRSECLDDDGRLGVRKRMCFSFCRSALIQYLCCRWYFIVWAEVGQGALRRLWLLIAFLIWLFRDLFRCSAPIEFDQPRYPSPTHEVGPTSIYVYFCAQSLFREASQSIVERLWLYYSSLYPFFMSYVILRYL